MDSLYARIDAYLASDKSTPIIVDIPSHVMLEEVYTHYDVPGYQFVRSSHFCMQDETPQIDKLQHELMTSGKNEFLFGLSTHLKLQGEQVLKKELRRLLDMNIAGKLVIFTFQCREYLNYGDPRLEAASRIIIQEGDFSAPAKVIFVKENVDYHADASVKGIKELPKLYEAIEQYPVICVKTNKTRRDYPDSMIAIEVIDSSYSAIQHSYSDFKDFEKESGKESQWKYLLKSLNNRKGWGDFLEYAFGGIDNLLPSIAHFSTFDKDKQWAYFIALRKHGAIGNKYLTAVLSKANTFDDFISGLYDTILEFDCGSNSFNEKYQQRKQILKGLNGYTPVLATYLKRLSEKKEKALYYLTDLTRQEKEQILEVISLYAESYSKADLLAALKAIYPDLYLYMQSYRSGIRLIDDYFDEYKYCKLTNRITENMRFKVEEQATLREYNKDLQNRSWYVDKIDKSNTELYFVDALGVEYLSYIQAKCFERNMSINVKIGHCDLPSITCINKGFVEPFKSAGCGCVDIKELDEVKHSGQKNYNYENTKAPIHVAEELRLIDSWIEKIETDLSSGKAVKVVMVSDHGASRLAVINETENSIEVSEKGQHSGRCCPKADSDVKPDFATEENDFWCLANYDRFRGGRKANVEVHGGASLEEVAVPIIEVTKADKRVECNLCDDSSVVYVSFKKKASIRIFVAENSDNVAIAINSRIFQAEKTEDKFYYRINLPDIKKSGIYNFDIQLDGNIIKRDISFEVKKEGASERNYF